MPNKKEKIDKSANNNGLISIEDRLSDNSDFGSSDYSSDEGIDEEEKSDIQENCNHDEKIYFHLENLCMAIIKFIR